VTRLDQSEQDAVNWTGHIRWDPSEHRACRPG